MSKEAYTTLTESKVNTAIARLTPRQLITKNNIHNDTLSAKLKATKSSDVKSSRPKLRGRGQNVGLIIIIIIIIISGVAGFQRS